MRIIPKLAGPLVLPLLLTGCFIPPAVTIASLAADGISLAASGKSVKDHALSEISGEDCAMWRVMKSEDICLVEVGASETVLVAYKGPETAVDAPWTEPPANTADMDVMRRGFLHLGEPQSFEQMATMRDPTGLTLYAPTAGANTDATSDVTIAEVPAQESLPASTLERAPEPVLAPVSAPISIPISDRSQAPIQVAVAPPVSGLPFDAGDMMPLIPGADAPAVALQSFAAAVTPSMGQVARLARAEMSAVSTATVVPAAADQESWADGLSESSEKSAARSDDGVYLVLGSFTAPEQANLVAAGYGDLVAHVRAAEVGGQARFRVVAGPFTSDEARTRREQAVGAGVVDAWIARL
ncbi:MAG: hypothetical protein HN420_16735 [Rhodospirillaceae bacterium]|nr:hypothetical protein [Rhodospirillaceae bacterium]MBT5415638.1 hypothetical protein [Rhodospirillaceae bacterium]